MYNLAAPVLLRSSERGLIVIAPSYTHSAPPELNTFDCGSALCLGGGQFLS